MIVNIFQVETSTMTLFTQDATTAVMEKLGHRVIAKFRIKLKDKKIFNPLIQNSYFLHKKAPQS